jgi:protein involved in polysaccharide export with SLBB domain
MTRKAMINKGILLIVLYFLLNHFSFGQNPNYFITGAKKTGYDTLAKQTSQKLALESAGIFEKEIDPAKYILGPDDQLMVSIISANPQEFEVPISPDGRILIPQVGAIDLKNKTLAEAEDHIKEKVSKVYKTNEVYVVLKKLRKFKVAISGEVFSSTIVPATAVDRVSEIAEKAGGFKHTASLRHIKLLRDNKIITV